MRFIQPLIMLLIIVLTPFLINIKQDISIVPKFIRIKIEQNSEQGIYNAREYDLSPTNTGKENSIILQTLIDSIPSNTTIYIPSGEYEFSANGYQTIGSHCIKMRSNVNIVGDGEGTILKPSAQSAHGLDMFYFNELLDKGVARYLENCTFKDFVIDAINTSSSTYTSAGKGFMFNLYKNCHWENVIVKNTDGTGFGMDCPIDSTIINCKAINCGKAATTFDSGASGFGIGFGYSDEENIKIESCIAIDNKKFGFFFEHQGVFNPNLYQSTATNGFYVTKCIASNNYYNFGGIVARDVTYEDCISKNSIDDGFYFKDSINYHIINCHNIGK